MEQKFEKSFPQKYILVFQVVYVVENGNEVWMGIPLSQIIFRQSPFGFQPKII